MNLPSLEKQRSVRGQMRKKSVKWKLHFKMSWEVSMKRSEQKTTVLTFNTIATRHCHPVVKQLHDFNRKACALGDKSSIPDLDWVPYSD